MSRILTCALLLAAAWPAFGQPGPVAGGPPPPPPPPPDEELTASPTGVGYIDLACPVDQIRLRADFGYDFQVPTRAEFFYPRSRPFGPGLPQPERSVDFQDQTLYLEKTVGPNWSVFAEGGTRFLNPEINADHAGLSDVNLGFKYAFLADECQTWTFQLRTYLPAGAAGRGLGTHHVSLEPGVLGFVWLTDRLGLASELRYWQPIGGTEFAAPIVRYGLGLRYDLIDGDGWRLAPTAEAVGWTVLGGHESRLMPDGKTAVLDSAGVTVVNVKLGARLDLGRQASIYAGYGQAVTGDRWYRDVFRIEFQWLY
jgi:hypothetical protein